jgi:hypothetical protein
MSYSGKAAQFSAAFACVGLVFGSTAHAAPSTFTSVDPLVSLSVFGTSSSRAAVCAASTAAASAAATTATTASQPGPGGGCVLPVLGQAAPPPMVETPIGIAPMAPSGSFGLSGLLPLFAVLGLGALAIFLLENDKDKGPPPLSPV